MSTTPIEYRHGVTTFEGVLVHSDAIPTPAPTVLVCHGMEGKSEELVELAKLVLPWGYQAFVVALYGKGTSDATSEQFETLMRLLLEDRTMLADRLSAVISTVAGLPEVDSSRIMAIGFCFGGLCVLDMARTGAGIT